MSEAAARQVRQLHRGHFAFMRALLQGLDEKESWNRYLRGEGESADLRTIRHTIGWIRDAFAAAAQREARPGTARLIRLDPERFSTTDGRPTLEAFAAERGLEDFSEAEQAEAYAEAYPDEPAGGTPLSGRRGRARRPTQRSRVVAHQLAALRWLETLVAQDPRPGDDVREWLNPAVAARLYRCGYRTLESLVSRINEVGTRWWRDVPGVGVHKAARVVAWLDAHAHVVELRLEAHAVVPRRAMPQKLRDNVVAAATALRPLEKFLIPAALDGHSGRNRAPVERCLLHPADDRAAIAAWLKSKGNPSGVGVSATWRAYRKEAERLLLWSILERAKPLSSLSSEDAREYCAFLTAPPPEWCGPRHYQRWSPQWRPLEGPLSPAARCHAMTVLKGLFAFLVCQNYLMENPFAAVKPPNRRTLGASRTLSMAQWGQLEAQLCRHVHSEAVRPVVRAVRWLYATGLRLAEITAARCGDLERFEHTDAAGVAVMGWRLAVGGRGHRSRHVPVPTALVTELETELLMQGACLHIQDGAARPIPILARFSGEGRVPSGWSCPGLAKAIKGLLGRVCAGYGGAEAARIQKVSAHWLRHSHALHALKGGPGQRAQPLEVVRRNLGHASRKTTATYRTIEVATDAP